MMVKCTKCGTSLTSHQFTCPVCGEMKQVVPDYDAVDTIITKNRDDRDDQRAREREAQRRRIARDEHRKKIKQRRIIVISIVAAILIGIIVAIYFAISYSYSGRLGKGNTALEEKSYKEAIAYFEEAIEKDNTKAAPYVGISEAYAKQEDVAKAETVLTEAVAKQKNNEELIDALFSFYVEMKQQEEIRVFIQKNELTKLSGSLKKYESKTPNFSLEPGTFEDVQELTLESSENKIYYTIDGSKPSTQSTLYEAPIQLSEGTTIIRAISSNKLGVPSSELEGEYTVEFPIEDAPIVTPSTGQYEEATKIEIIVPEGYSAYYTTDGTAPSDASTKYEGEIDMPEGNTIFSAILINSKGQMSDITKRNYDLSMNED